MWGRVSNPPAACDDERRPAPEGKALAQGESPCTIARKRGPCLCIEQPRKHHVAVRRNQSGECSCELLEGLEQDVGEHQVERRALAKTAGTDACGMHDIDASSYPV